MKKSARIIISLVLVFALALCVLTACNKDKTEVKDIDETEALALVFGDKSGVVKLFGGTLDVRVDYTANFDGAESGISICTYDGGIFYGSKNDPAVYQKNIKNGVETEFYVGYDFFLDTIQNKIKKDGTDGTIYQFIKITENGVSNKQLRKIENISEYNSLKGNSIVYYISTLGQKIFNKMGDIVDTVKCSGTRTYKNGNLENTTLFVTYEDEENSIQGKITLVLSADEKQISKATVEENGVVVFAGTYTYNVPTIILPLVSGDSWKERTSYEIV